MATPTTNKEIAMVTETTAVITRGNEIRIYSDAILRSYGNEEDAIEAAQLRLETAGLRNLEVDTGAEMLDDNFWKVRYSYTR